MRKPTDVFDRETEWAELTEFALADLPGLRIAVVFGRRRQGKSYLLRRLAEASGGLYFLATEQAETISLRRFGDTLATAVDLPSALRFDAWETALETAVDLLVRRRAGRTPLLVLDEFPYLATATPGLPSVVQSLYDRFGPGAGAPPVRLILCGSAISIMSELLSGTKALRGRGALELRIRPFAFRDARAFWGIDSPEVAFRHNALLGGTPGYRELVPQPTVPEHVHALDGWVAANVLRPSVPLFDEANRVIHEDPRIRDTAAYSSVLAAVAAGESSPTKIGGLLHRPATSLGHQLSMLESAGFVDRTSDLLLERRPVVTVADPVMRLHHLVIEPFLGDLEAGRAAEIWAETTHTVESKVFGPHFEALCREWVTRFGRDEAGLVVGATGQAVVACRTHRTGHEVDVLSLSRGVRPRTAGAPIAFLGEAKFRAKRQGLAELERLEHIRDLLSAAGHDATGAVLGIFSASGFSDDLRARAARDDRLRIITLNDLYQR
ncbi:MAG: AAA family ATPase [Hamadaea sp.]|nr:AAA family ATPase [Hamadaea sp.]